VVSTNTQGFTLGWYAPPRWGGEEPFPVGAVIDLRRQSSVRQLDFLPIAGFDPHLA
jgi:hypothetical protein